MKLFKQILLYLISLNLAVLYIQHGWMKFDPEGFWSKAFIERWGYGEFFMYFIGVLEFGGGIALLIPRAWRYGAAILAVVMLGALVTRLIFGTSVDDVVYIAGNMVLLTYIAIVRGFDKDLMRFRGSKSSG